MTFIIIGFFAFVKRPTGITVKATSSTALEYIDITSDANQVFSIGILPSIPTTKIAGIPKPFHIGTQDEYVKWRANESIYNIPQRGFVRKKR